MDDLDPLGGDDLGGDDLGGDDDEDNNAWAVAYGDLISALLCFFILLLSISVVNPNKFEMLKGGVHQIEEKTSIEDLQKKIDDLVAEENLSEVVKVNKTYLGVDVSIGDELLFSSGSAVINPKSSYMFKKLLQSFSELPKQYTFQIEGHTDDLAIKTKLFPSNWYLSSSRALSVLDLFLKHNIDPSRLEVQGFAATRPEYPNFDDKGNPINKNRKLNRRVVIKVR